MHPTTPSLPAPTLATHPREIDLVAARKRSTDPHETIGQRLARLRRERGLTQVELAAQIDVSQPVLSDYERGTLRLHGQLIVQLAGILGVSADELLGLEKPRTGSAAPNRRLLRRLQQLEKLPKRDQQALLRTIDAFLAKAS